MAPKRKYDNSYIKLGFTSIESNGETKPQCVICATVLSNDALKPAKLKRHLETVHPNFCGRPPEFFEGKLLNLKKMKLGPSGTRFASSESALAASFEISKLIAQSKKPHMIGETLVKPCLIKAVEEVLRIEARNKIQEIPLSNNIVKARIEITSNDIQKQLVSKIKKSPYFALQCDESTDVSNCSQLLVFVRFLDNDNTIKEELLISQELETTSRGIDVMKVINDYFEKHNIMWEKLAGFCTNGAPAMLASRSGLVTLIKQKNPYALTAHCIIHRQALASKTLPQSLVTTMQLAIKVVNFIKSSALNTRLLKKLCSEMGSEHETLLFHTEVCWLSKGNMLGRLYELTDEVKLFLVEKKMKDLLQKFSDLTTQIQLAYLVDIFSHLNKLNLQLQGSENRNLEGMANIFVFEDKLRDFICKLQLWIGKVSGNNFSAFETLNKIVDDKKCVTIRSTVQGNIGNHLQMLVDEFNHYFPEYNQADLNGIQKLIRNPFGVNVGEVADEVQIELTELQNDRNCKDAFQSGNNLEEFWCKKVMSYTELRKISLRYLMLFSTTYLCEQGFSALLVIKNKSRNRLNASDMRVALSNISPRITQLVKKMQGQKSH